MSDFVGWLPSLLGKMAISMYNAVRRYVLIRKFNFEGAKMRLFHSFGIKDALVKRLVDLRIEKPTAIQEKVSYMKSTCCMQSCHKSRMIICDSNNASHILFFLDAAK